MRSLLLLIAFLLATTPALANPEEWTREGWRTDFSRMGVPASEIRSGGPPRDGIPPIDAPKLVPLAEAPALADIEPVIGLEIEGDARAYPLQVLIWHEIANDIVGGVPVAVTYCPLCNAAIVFDRRLDGQTLDFGTTGKLRNSDLIMYDRQTESWWQQFSGDAIAGSYLGKRLMMIPARLESYAEFKVRHPQGKVLVPSNPAFRPYGINPYHGYDSAALPFLYDGEMPKGIEPMARVVVFDAEDKTHAVSLDHLRAKSPLEIGGVALSWRAGQASAVSAEEVAGGHDVGGVIATKGGADIVVHVTFAFVAHAFHPGIAILGAK